MNDKTTGIVLKQSDYRENDALVTIYTQAYGLCNFVARGIRKMESKNAAALYPYSEVELLFDYTEGKDLFVLHSAHLVHNYRHIQTSLTKTAVFNVIAELSIMVGGELRYDPQASEQLYQLLDGCLKEIDQNEDTNLPLGLFLANILDMMGIAPEVDGCAVCGKSQITSISVEQGGFVCADCSPDKPLEIKQLKQFRLLNKAHIENMDVLRNFGPYGFQNCEILMQFLQTYLNIHLKSWPFLNQVRGM